eukprot:GHRQ01022884.1.p2 GENE.GHRQ01022884.1~~GHRQ01022884.1.p2  ORF type:complete len:114 (-),score=50.80 GHRQ01022884.1:381-722(-)
MRCPRCCCVCRRLQPQQSIPSIHIPLHTVIELTPLPDGTMGVEYIPVPIQLGDNYSNSTAASPAAATEAQQPSAQLQQQCQQQADLAAAAAAGAGAVPAAVAARPVPRRMLLS